MSQSFDVGETINRIKESFRQLSRDEKTQAFSQLLRIPGTKGASAFMDLLRQYVYTGIMPENTIWSLGTVREHADIYFPELLNYAAIPKFGHRTYALCALYMSCKWLPPDKLESHFDLMMSHYQSLKDQWDQKDNYFDKYNQIYFLLEIFGYFTKPEVDAELSNALDLYGEVGLKYQAISSLWRLGKSVGDKYILDLIADDSMRWSMFWRLQERGELRLFPEQYRTAEAFARATIVATMVDWYGLVEGMEFIEKISINTEYTEDNGDYYIYRVYSDLSRFDEKIWTGAWSGPAPAEFDFFQMKMPQAIFNRSRVAVEGWDNNSPETHIMNYLGSFHKDKTS